jgi:hypothetical protein
MAKKNKFVLWTVYNAEEVPVAVSYAKTSSGAKARYEEATGNSRFSVHVEKMAFEHNCAVFSTALIEV